MFLLDVCAAQVQVACSSEWSFPGFPDQTIFPGLGNTQVAKTNVNYGKYYNYSPYCDRRGNSFNVFYKVPSNFLRKTVIEIHGGGFTGGSLITTPNNEVKKYVKNGFTYISFDYRLVAKMYYFWLGSEEHEEEYIEVSEDGVLTIDPSQDMSEYPVQVGRQEFVTKCIYDAVQAMNFVVANNVELKVNINSIGFIGASAGGGICNYLIWTYPNLYGNTGISVRSATFKNAQLDYTVQNALDKTWSHWVDELGPDAKLKNYLERSGCKKIVGNPWCTVSSTDETTICNHGWQQVTNNRFCKTNFKFNQVTFGALHSIQVWPNVTTQDRGLAYLWYVSEQMAVYQPPGFVLYVYNYQGGATGEKNDGALAHHSLFSKRYSDFCLAYNISCIVYFKAWTDIKPSSLGTALNNGKRLIETFPWRQTGGSGTTPASSTERMEVHKWAAFGGSS